MPLFGSERNISIKRIASVEEARDFQPTFSLSELSPKHRVVLNDEVDESFKEFEKDINRSGKLFDAAILGYKGPAKKMFSRDLFDPKNIADWRKRLSRTESQLAYFVNLEAMLSAYAPEERHGLSDDIKGAIRETVNEIRKNNNDFDWKYLFWLCSNAKIVEPTEDFLTKADWEYIEKSLTNGTFRWMKVPEDALTALARIRIINPSLELPITAADWEKYKHIMDDPKHESIFGHVVLMHSAELTVLASGGVESTASGVRLLPPIAHTKSEVPLPVRKHI